MPAKPRFRRAFSVGRVELWKDSTGNKFIRFKNSSLQPHEIPAPEKIPTKNYGGINFVTSFKTKVGGRKQRVWAKEAGSDLDYKYIVNYFKSQKRAYSRNLQHARVLRELRAAGFRAPEPLGILFIKGRERPLLLTKHIKGKFASVTTKLEKKLIEAGFNPDDIHKRNVLESKKGKTVIDASLFKPTDKRMLAEAIEKQKRNAIAKPKRSMWSTIKKMFGL